MMYRQSEERHFAILDIVAKSLGGKENTKAEGEAKELQFSKAYKNLSIQEQEERTKTMKGFHKNRISNLFGRKEVGVG